MAGWNVIAYLDSALKSQPVTAATPLPVALTSTAAATATGTITSVAGSASDGTILAANTGRKGAAIFNDSAAILYLALASGTSSASNYTVQLAPGGYYEVPVSRDGTIYTGVIKGIWASATGNARVTEFS